MLFMAFDRTLIELGPLHIQWYALCIATGIAAGFLLAKKEFQRFGWSIDTLYDVVTYGTLAAIVGARLYYVAFEWEHYRDNLWSILAIYEGGLAIHGGLIGAFLFVTWYLPRKGIPYFRFLDVAAPSLFIGQIIGRWGNFFNQEAYGRMIKGTLNEGHDFLSQTLHLPEFIVEQMYIDGAYYHPTFLYEGIWNSIGLLLVLFVLRKRNFPGGIIFGFYLIWYSLGRFFIEGMRTDSLYLFGTLRIAQVMSCVLLLIGFVIICYAFLKKTEAYLGADSNIQYDKDLEHDVIEEEKQKEEEVV